MGNDIVELTFNLTWYCPIHCEYCYRARINDNSDMRILSEDALRRECQKAKQIGITQYRFSGGEPLSIGDKLFEYADIVYEVTGHKPVVLTSGYLITNNWLEKARNKFLSIAISVDNPFKYSASNKMLNMIREYTSKELPLTYGVTLVEATYFNKVFDIFKLMYENVDRKFMPQLDYNCLQNYVQPTKEQCNDLIENTKKIITTYGLPPYYFVYLIGSPLWIDNNIQRYVLNLHPEGNYQIYENMEERLSVERRWRSYLREQQLNSKLCLKCEWIDVCQHHPLWDIRYDWCSLRKALFEGMYLGLKT